MIEELKLLLPLLQSAGEGAFWLVLAFLVKDVLTFLMWPVAVVCVAWFVTRGVRAFHKVDEQNWRMRSDLIDRMRKQGYMDSENWVGYKQLARLEKLLDDNPYKEAKQP